MKPHNRHDDEVCRRDQSRISYAVSHY